MANSNNPPILVELTPELAQFVKDNCETNLAFGLQALGTLTSRDLQEQMVQQMENFKALRQAVIEAVKPI